MAASERVSPRRTSGPWRSRMPSRAWLPVRSCGLAPGRHQGALAETLDHAYRPRRLDQQVRSALRAGSVIDLVAPMHRRDDRLSGARVAVGEQSVSQLGHDPFVLGSGRHDPLGLASTQVDPEPAPRRRRTVGTRTAPVDAIRHLVEGRERLGDGALQTARHEPRHPAEARAPQAPDDRPGIDADRPETPASRAVAAAGRGSRRRTASS